MPFSETSDGDEEKQGSAKPVGGSNALTTPSLANQNEDEEELLGKLVSFRMCSVL